MQTSQLLAAVARVGQAVQVQAEIWQSFSFFPSRPHDFLDVHNRDFAQRVAILGQTCFRAGGPETDTALGCYAAISRQPYSLDFVRGRSATEFILNWSHRIVGTCRNTAGIELALPHLPSEVILDKLRRFLKWWSENVVNSSAMFLQQRTCRNLLAEVEWEAAKALDKARTMETDNDAESTPEETKGRHAERDAEVIRLKKEDPKRSGTQIANIVRKNPAWANMENGKPLNGRAVNAVIRRARDRGDLP
jgi:hypothetical protein